MDCYKYAKVKLVETQLFHFGLALSFLHDSAKLFHCNLTPHSIVVTDKGSWKLAGLEFSKKSDDDNFKWQVVSFYLFMIIH